MVRLKAVRPSKSSSHCTIDILLTIGSGLVIRVVSSDNNLQLFPVLFS